MALPALRWCHGPYREAHPSTDASVIDEIGHLKKRAVVPALFLQGLQLEETAMHHGSALDEFTTLTVQSVGAGLLHHDDRARRGMAVFGRHGKGEYLNFLNGY